jgi:hypothetical protein
MSELPGYLKKIVALVLKQNDISDFLKKTDTSLTSKIGMGEMQDLEREYKKRGRADAGANKLDAAYNEMICYHLISYKYMRNYDYVQAFEYQKLCLTECHQLFRSGEYWLTKSLYILISDVNNFAKLADESEARLGRKSDYQDNTASGILMPIFRECAQDRSTSNATQGVATLRLANTLLRIYFRRNNLAVCKSLFEGINTKMKGDEKFFSLFPIDQRVTYLYYVGKYSIFDSKLKKAYDSLSTAFYRCSKSYPNNRRCLLLQLIPLNFFLHGRKPTLKVLEEYNLVPFFHRLLCAARSGNVAVFSDEMTKYAAWYIKNGIYLLVEKIRWIAYRNFIKKIYYLRRQTLPSGKNQNNLDLEKICLPILKKVDPKANLDIDELECIFGNLIYIGYIKGYIAQKSHILVTAKSSPFPKLSTVSGDKS